MHSMVKWLRMRSSIGIADSVHKVFSSTFEHFPNGRGEHPFRIARMSAIDVGIHAIRAGRHLCDEALRYLWTGTSRHFHLITHRQTGAKCV